jgi:acetoin utilization deacetylase AcuC-like enzyme
MNLDNILQENVEENNIIKDIVSNNVVNKNLKKSYMVGIVDDKRCELHIQTDNHIESPERIRAIRHKLKATGLYNKLIPIEPIDPTRDDLLLVHSNRYINKIVRMCTKYKKGMIDSKDVRISGESSLVSAGVAVGGVISAVNTVLNSENIRKVFCNIRPPGHHASAYETGGFCIFNNVAIGAKKALQHSDVKRILIFEWDLDHGNGTEKIFKCNKNVMFVSFHKIGKFCLNPEEQYFKGKYNNVHNYTLDDYSTTEDYMNLFNNDFLPKARIFRPDIIFISCGFNSHKDDTNSGLPLTSDHFRVMTKELCQLADQYSDGRLISVLEGGYNLDIISECAAVHVDELLINS